MADRSTLMSAAVCVIAGCIGGVICGALQYCYESQAAPSDGVGVYTLFGPPEHGAFLTIGLIVAFVAPAMAVFRWMTVNAPRLDASACALSVRRLAILYSVVRGLVGFGLVVVVNRIGFSFHPLLAPLAASGVISAPVRVGASVGVATIVVSLLIELRGGRRSALTRGDALLLSLASSTWSLLTVAYTLGLHIGPEEIWR